MTDEALREARVEMMTAGLLVLLGALYWFAGLREPLAMTLGGLILLGSGIYQTSRGWHVALTTWLLGLILFFGGIGVRVAVVAYLRIQWVPIALALVGGYIIWRALFINPDQRK